MNENRYITDSISTSPEYIIIQPVGKHELEFLNEEKSMIRNAYPDTAFVSVYIDDWNAELSPWKCPQAYGNDIFEGRAADTLELITNKIIPDIKKHYPDNSGIILGGYSLAGLFSLWAGYRTDIFDAVAACSPSVWIDGWSEFINENRFIPKYAYLSIGSKEHKTKNSMMSRVREALEYQKSVLDSGGTVNILEINPGNHFTEPQKRTAGGFAECIRMMKQEKQICG